MSATDDLRRMLDERGVEWSDNSDENVTHTTWDGLNCWFNEYPDGWTSWGMAKHGTPEQAIAATLGRTCYCTTEESAWCFVCSECGKSFPRSDLHYAYNHGEINYCPNCGAKVVER